MVDKTGFICYTNSIDNKESKMATDLKTQAQGVKLTRFFGGLERGVCVQVDSDKFRGHIQLTREQARRLAKDLEAFADGKEVEFFG